MSRWFGGTVIAAGIAAVSVLSPVVAHADDPNDLKTYYSMFDRGKNQLPDLDKYVPQGLAYWKDQDALVVSYYRHGAKARIALLDRKSRKPLRSFDLDDTGHAGGVAIGGKYMWVASTKSGRNQMIRYPVSALAGKNGSTLTRDKEFDLKASSYVDIDGDTMYVGKFTDKGPGTLYRYKLTNGEKPDYVDSSKTPEKVQGVAVVGGTKIFSSSFGRAKRSTLLAGKRKITAPNMLEDTESVDGQLYAIYESGAAEYANAGYRVRTVHSAPLNKVLGK